MQPAHSYNPYNAAIILGCWNSRVDWSFRSKKFEINNLVAIRIIKVNLSKHEGMLVVLTRRLVRSRVDRSAYDPNPSCWIVGYTYQPLYLTHFIVILL